MLQLRLRQVHARTHCDPSGSPAVWTCSRGTPWLGSFLNYLTMTRLESTKWVMMGGKCVTRVAAGTCYPGGTLRMESNERCERHQCERYGDLAVWESVL